MTGTAQGAVMTRRTHVLCTGDHKCMADVQGVLEIAKPAAVLCSMNYFSFLCLPIHSHHVTAYLIHHLTPFLLT